MSIALVRATNRCIRGSRISLYVKTLKRMGFILNPYDKCVANKMINGKQCTVAWYVDDNKLSHVQPEVITQVLEVVKGHFAELEISRGDEHNLLGMKIVMNRENRSVIISMRDRLYVRQFIVVHVPRYSALFPINNFIGNAFVIGTQNKADPFQSLTVQIDSNQICTLDTICHVEGQ